MDYPGVGRFEGADITKYSIALDTGHTPVSTPYQGMVRELVKTMQLTVRG
jgi:hypothetical protein